MGILQRPTPDPTILANRSRIVRDLERLIGQANVIGDDDGCRSFETDALTAYAAKPLAVVLPETTEQVAATMAYCHTHGVKVVPRGAGTSLAGGALPAEDGIVLGLGRMSQVLEIDYANRSARVQAGITNLAISEAVGANGFFYAPDPSSQLACTIAGNIAMNSGGAHCLKYGVTTNNLLGVRMVLVDGTIVDIGGAHLDAPGYDLLGLIVGSEGQFGVVTEATVRILKKPEGARPMLIGFRSSEDAGTAVARIIAAGIVPVAIEFMDKPAIQVCESFAKAGYPLDVEAMLIIEVEGSDAEIDEALSKIRQLASPANPTTIRISQSETETAAIWRGRKSAFGAIGRVADYLCMDGTIPLSRLPETLTAIAAIAERFGFRAANIFHAGDGNLHPLILYDANQPGAIEQVEACGAEILKHCVAVGGCLTGEHGVGIEKRDLMPLQFTPTDLAQQKRLKEVFDPGWLLNPGKVLPLDLRETE
ncbi:MAG: FAD-linked oxidase C-terminal domain-containing protein [Hyphomicrobiaceae bacterium]